MFIVKHIRRDGNRLALLPHPWRNSEFGNLKTIKEGDNFTTLRRSSRSNLSWPVKFLHWERFYEIIQQFRSIARLYLWPVIQKIIEKDSGESVFPPFFFRKEQVFSLLIADGPVKNADESRAIKTGNFIHPLIKFN